MKFKRVLEFSEEELKTLESAGRLIKAVREEFYTGSEEEEEKILGEEALSILQALKEGLKFLD